MENSSQKSQKPEKSHFEKSGNNNLTKEGNFGASTWEVEIGGSGYHGHPWLQGKCEAYLDYMR